MIKAIVTGMSNYSPAQLLIAANEGINLEAAAEQESNTKVTSSAVSVTKFQNFNAQTYTALPNDSKPTLKLLIDLLTSGKNFADIKSNFSTILDQYRQMGGL